MPLTIGDRLGPYQILGPLGQGGMGEVWKARDTRLDRTVAIKKSHSRFSERFEREARAIAALNHPHICSLYDVGPDFLVMEYIEGKPLEGPVPLNEALMLASQILDALDAAHSKGITHRDLKPGNILVGRAGIKVLDFGLAKIEHTSKPARTDETETMPLTSEGAVLGTLQYMSPEQIEGQEADARSDIFAFGLVLYELITGKRAFQGKTKTSMVASILKDQPRSLSEFQPLSSLALERVVQTCLEKDPEKRWQSAREVKHALEWISADAPPAPVLSPAPTGWRWLWPSVAALFAVIAAVAGWALWQKPNAPLRATRFQVLLPENVTMGEYISLSPDGRKLVLNTTGQQNGLWVRDLDTLQSRLLPGTGGARSPFWSPDSRFLAFAAGNDLKKIEASGGPPQTLCTSPNQVGSGAWNRDGVIVFGVRGSGPLRRVSEAGGVATEITAVDTSRGERFHSLPSFLPDGKQFLFFRQGPAGIAGMYAGRVDAKPAEQAPERIIATRFAAQYVNGYVFFMREDTLLAQAFDAGRLQPKGEPITVAEHIGTIGAIGVFSVSASGALAYRAGTTAAANFQLTWFDRQGKILGTFGDPGPYIGLALSPDGKGVAYRDAPQNASGDIAARDFTRGIRTPITSSQSLGSFPVWSPEGTRIGFTTRDLDTLYERPSNGVRKEDALLKRPGESMFPTSWSHDGRFLLYYVTNPKTAADIWVLPLDGDRKPVLLLGGSFNESLASFSPDMRWIAYASDESGRSEIYVRPFLASGSRGGPSLGPTLGDDKWPMSKDGGTLPKWTADGKELIYRAPDGSPMAMDVSAGPATAKAATRLFPAPQNLGDWDVSADGKKFLMGVAPAQQTVQTPITVVLNWQADLKK